MCRHVITMRSAWILRSIVLAFLSFAAGMHCEMAAQVQPDTATRDRVHIDHADVVIGTTERGQEVTLLRGNVELSQDSVYLYCDSARVVNRREVTAYGNVIIQKGDSLQVFADTLIYFADTRIADLTGEVVLIHGTQQIWTTHLRYDMKANVAHYDRPAELLDGNTQLASKRGVYDVDTEDAVFVDSVVVIDPEFSLLTDSLRYAAKERRAYFVAPTWIVQQDAQIYCETGFYDLATRKAEFGQNPRYVKDDQRARAEVIAYDGHTGDVILIQDAQFVDATREASGDTIIYNEKTGDTRITGNAEFRDQRRHVRSLVIMYNRITEKITTEGRSVIADGSQIIRAEHIDFDQATGIGYLRGDVVLHDTAAGTFLLAEFADINRDSGTLIAYGTLRPMLKSAVDADTLYITADTLHTYEVRDTAAQDTVQYMRAYRDVRIFRNAMQGLCDSLTFDGRDSVFRMFGDPILWSDTTQFTADTIDLYMQGGQISRVVLLGNGLIISEVQAVFYNQIRGKRVVARVEYGGIRDMHVSGNAESIYYALDEAQAFLGVNRIASSEIFFTFEESKIQRIRFTTKPAGRMIPMKEADHDSMRLDGFRWRFAEKPKSLEDLF